MTDQLPKPIRTLIAEQPEVWDAYSRLGEAVSQAGSLDAKTRRLVKLALAIGGGSEGAVHSHSRRAGEDGCSRDDLVQVALLAIPTLGLPRAMAALTWISDVVTENQG